MAYDQRRTRGGGGADPVGEIGDGMVRGLAAKIVVAGIAERGGRQPAAPATGRGSIGPMTVCAAEPEPA